MGRLVVAYHPRMPATLVEPALLNSLTKHAPGVVAALTGAHDALWDSPDAPLLNLSRLRIAQLHEDETELHRALPGVAPASQAKRDGLSNWPGSPDFSATEQACLAFTELFVADVSAITQDDVDTVVAQLGPGRTYAFVQSLLFLDQHQRLKLATARLLAPTEATP